MSLFDDYIEVRMQFLMNPLFTDGIWINDQWGNDILDRGTVIYWGQSDIW